MDRVSNNFEGEKASLVWACGASSGVVRTACDIQIDGRRRAGRPKLTWKKLRKTAVSGSSRQLTFNKGAPGDQV